MSKLEWIGVGVLAYFVIGWVILRAWTWWEFTHGQKGAVEGWHGPTSRAEFLDSGTGIIVLWGVLLIAASPFLVSMIARPIFHFFATLGYRTHSQNNV